MNGINEVIIYSHDYCGPCKAFKPRLKAFCQSNGIKYKEVNTMTCTGEEETSMHQLKIKAVPFTVVKTAFGDKHYTGVFNIEKELE